MSAKKLIVATLISTLLTACGGNTAYQAPLPDDGTYDLPAGDDYGSDYGSDYGDDYSSDPGAIDPVTEPGATEPAVPAAGFALSGYVRDGNGKAIVGASVSIGSQTVLTDSNGKYSFKDISDFKVFLSVSKTGYDKLDQVAVEFTQQAPSAIKDVLLATKSSSDKDDDKTVESGFEHEMTFTVGKEFKSVSAMVVEDDVVYVLGVVDKLLFDRTTVVAFDADTGEELTSFNKTGFFTHLPKNASFLKVDDGQVYVSNGETSYIFSAQGEFLNKGSGANYAQVKEVVDDDRNITYTLKSGNDLYVKEKNKTRKTYDLKDSGSIRAIGLDSEGRVLVLDTTNRTVHQFTFHSEND